MQSLKLSIENIVTYLYDPGNMKDFFKPVLENTDHNGDYRYISELWFMKEYLKESEKKSPTVIENMYNTYTCQSLSI